MSCQRSFSRALLASSTGAVLIVSNLLATGAAAQVTPDPSGIGGLLAAPLSPAAPPLGPAIPPRVGPVPPPPMGPPLPERASGARASRSRPVSAVGSPRGTAALGRAALARLGYDVASTGFRVEFRPGRQGLLGETFLERRVIRMYVRPGQTVPQIARVLAHEVGHAVDVSSMNSSSRQRWLTLRGASGTPWWPGQGRSDFASGAGDFAEVFARWLLGEQMRFRSAVAPAPAPPQLAELATTFFHPQARASRAS